MYEDREQSCCDDIRRRWATQTVVRIAEEDTVGNSDFCFDSREDMKEILFFFSKIETETVVTMAEEDRNQMST